MAAAISAGLYAAAMRETRRAARFPMPSSASSDQSLASWA